MALLTHGEKPFGVRDAQIAPLTGDTPAGGVDFPRVQSAEMGEEEDTAEMSGDDVQQAIHTYNSRMSGSLQGGGINLDSLVILTGGSVSTEGMGDTLVVEFERAATDVKPYFQMTAQMIDDSEGDLHLVTVKTKVTSGPQYAFTGGEFASTNADTQAVYNDAGILYRLLSHKIVTDIPDII